MKLFVSTSAVGPTPSDVDGALAALAALPCDGIELGSTHAWRADFAAAVRARWTGPTFVHNYCPPARQEFVLNIASVDAHVRAASVAHAKQSLAFATEVGASLYTIHPGYLAEPTGRQGERGYDFAFAENRAGHERALAAMVESLKALADDAARLGVTLAIETEGSATKPGVLLMETPDEYERLFDALPNGVALNFNLAHSRFAAKLHGFSLQRFVEQYRARFAAAELSHNGGAVDEHRPLTADSWVLDWIPRLDGVPLILEFRDASRTDIERSLVLARAQVAAAA